MRIGSFGLFWKDQADRDAQDFIEAHFAPISEFSAEEKGLFLEEARLIRKRGKVTVNASAVLALTKLLALRVALPNDASMPLRHCCRDMEIFIKKAAWKTDSDPIVLAEYYITLRNQYCEKEFEA